MVNIFGSVPMFTPLEVPIIPEPIVEVETRAETWWYEDTRSGWVVLEDCWSNDEPHHQWWALEGSIRSTLEMSPVSRLVSSDLDWTDNGFCIRLQGLKDEVLHQRQNYADIVTNAEIEPVHRDISTLDHSHFSWVYDEIDIPRMRRQNRIWRTFWEGASLRTVYGSQAPLPLEPWGVPSK